MIKIHAFNFANDDPPLVKFTFLILSYGTLTTVALQGAPGCSQVFSAKCNFSLIFLGSHILPARDGCIRPFRGNLSQTDNWWRQPSSIREAGTLPTSRQDSHPQVLLPGADTCLRKLQNHEEPGWARAEPVNRSCIGSVSETRVQTTAGGGDVPQEKDG